MVMTKAQKLVLEFLSWDNGVTPKEKGKLYKRVSAEEVQQIVEAVYRHEPVLSIGGRMGRDHSTVARVFKKTTGTSIREFKDSLKRAGAHE